MIKNFKELLFCFKSLTLVISAVNELAPAWFMSQAIVEWLCIEVWPPVPPVLFCWQYRKTMYGGRVRPFAPTEAFEGAEELSTLPCFC